MTHLRVSFQNTAGELDYRIVDSAEDAVVEAVVMLQGTPYLNPGDKIVVTEEED